MRPDKLKKALLAVLLLIAGYIWWGNVQTFYSDTGSYEQERGESADLKSARADADDCLKYAEPRINPFKRPPRRDQQPATSIPLPGRSNPAPSLSTTYKLSGFILENKAAQAVLTNSQGLTVVLAVKDSLAGWELSRIIDNLVVFHKDKLYDTLWLDKSLP